MIKFVRNVIIVLILIVVAGMAYDKWQANDVMDDGIIPDGNIIQNLYTKIGLP